MENPLFQCVRSTFPRARSRGNIPTSLSPLIALLEIIPEISLPEAEGTTRDAGDHQGLEMRLENQDLSTGRILCLPIQLGSVNLQNPFPSHPTGITGRILSLLIQLGSLHLENSFPSSWDLSIYRILSLPIQLGSLHLENPLPSHPTQTSPVTQFLSFPSPALQGHPCTPLDPQVHPSLVPNSMGL